jgi:hypothetical protein
VFPKKPAASVCKFRYADSMVINHRHRFVFIHVPKTAGSSIAAALMSLDGSEGNPVGKTKHTTASQLLRRYGEREPRIAGYRFFAFVRNPWDRFVSLHRFLLATKSERWPVPKSASDLARLLGDGEPWVVKLHSSRPQSDFLRGASIKIGRYETLQPDLDCIASELGLGLPALPHLKKTADDAVHRDALTAEAVAIVGNHFRADVENFGYKFQP